MTQTLNKVSKANARPVLTAKGYKGTRKYFTNNLEENSRRK